MTSFPETPPPHSPDCVYRERLLTVTEVADLLRVRASWIYERSRRSGADQIPHFKLGKYLRFSEQAVLEWLENLENKGF
jgi:excisionase family DNA binding protein